MAKYFSLNSSMMGPMAWTPKHQSMLEKIITAGFQQLGNAVFVESQRRVPVITGNLKSTGSVNIHPDGFEVTYTAPYATDVEVGRKKGSTGADVPQPWVSQIPAHKRNTKAKGFGSSLKRGLRLGGYRRGFVKAHTKTYTSGKPVQMPDGQWRIVSGASAIRGRHFVGRSLRSLLKNTFSTTSGFQKYLKTDTL